MIRTRTGQRPPGDFGGDDHDDLHRRPETRNQLAIENRWHVLFVRGRGVHDGQSARIAGCSGCVCGWDGDDLAAVTDD